MRLTALLPILCSLTALILSFLCLFAGHKQGFMEDYSLMTLNTSMIGQTLLTPSQSGEDSSFFDSVLNYIPDSITDGVNSAIGAAASRLGIEDFYSAHMMNYCYGQFELEDEDDAEDLKEQVEQEGNVNATTIDEADVAKNTTGCSATKAMYKFDPTKIIRDALAKTGVDVTLEDLNWPDDIQTGIDTLNILMNAMFILYILAIALIFLTLLGALAALFMAGGRLSACVNFLLALLAFLAVGIASALVTAVIIKAVGIINEHGEDVGIEANKGGKFLALTWAATGLMFLVVCAWVGEFCLGRRRREREVRYAKHG